ncbi:glycosyltransferase family 4 protein [Phocaeicola sp.]
MVIVFFDSTENFISSKSAGNTKINLLAQEFLSLKDKVYIIEFTNEACVSKEINGIKYIPYLYSRSLKKRIGNYLSTYRQLTKHSKEDVIIITSSIRITNIGFFIMAKFCSNIKLCYLFHEWHWAVNNSFINRFIGLCFDSLLGFLCNAILPISTFLFDKSIKFRKPIYKVPIVAKFPFFNIGIDVHKQYFIYCGHSNYRRVIDIVLLAFSKIDRNNVELILVLYGNQDNICKLNNLIHKNKIRRVRILQGLPDKELHSLYSGAIALLAPLDEKNIQDKARFSQKIAEYLSSGRPIITVNVGDISHYFTHLKNAYIADSFSPDSFAELMNLALNDPILSGEIGYNGYLLGRNNFSVESVVKGLRTFLSSI